MSVRRKDLVLLSERLGPITLEEQRLEAGGTAIVSSAQLWTHADIRANAGDAAAVVIGATEPFDATALQALPDLRAIIRRGVGLDNVDLAAATALGIVVANVPDASVEEVSDHALTLLLAVERRILPLDAAVREGMWHRDPGAVQAIRVPIRRLSELSLGIVGFGRIGQSLARKAAGVYGSIMAADPYGLQGDADGLGVGLVDLDTLISSADHLSLHAPLTRETHHLLDAAAMARMRPGAIVVNTARGGLVDEGALAEAIGSGHLGGAGIDVTEYEPIPIADPILTVERTLLTGHSAMASTTAQRELARRSVDATIDLLAGRMPASIVEMGVLASPVLRIPELRTRDA